MCVSLNSYISYATYMRIGDCTILRLQVTVRYVSVQLKMTQGSHALREDALHLAGSQRRSIFAAANYCER